MTEEQLDRYLDQIRQQARRALAAGQVVQFAEEPLWCGGPVTNVRTGVRYVFTVVVPAEQVAPQEKVWAHEWQRTPQP